MKKYFKIIDVDNPIRDCALGEADIIRLKQEKPSNYQWYGIGIEHSYSIAGMTLKYICSDKEGGVNLLDAYEQWYREHKLDIESSDATFKIIAVYNTAAWPVSSASLSRYTLDNFKGAYGILNRISGPYWTIEYKVELAKDGEPIYTSLEAAYKSYQLRNYWNRPAGLTYEEAFGLKLINPESKKETPMQFTISKKQIKKQIENLENIRQDQIREMQKDLALKVSALDTGKSFSPYVLGCDVLEEISSQLDYLYSLEVAESIICSVEEKDKIFKEFEITKSAE